jgi:hypothetical protein
MARGTFLVGLEGGDRGAMGLETLLRLGAMVALLAFGATFAFPRHDGSGVVGMANNASRETGARRRGGPGPLR